jgi:hypothetical protein
LSQPERVVISAYADFNYFMAKHSAADFPITSNSALKQHQFSMLEQA